MILHKCDEALMCKVFIMTLGGVAQDWFHTLAPKTISSFRELALDFMKEYTSYREIKKQVDHLFNLKKKHNESLQDYTIRFKAEKSNIVGFDNRITSSEFKKGLLIEHNLYCELSITPRQTFADVFATAERYALWDDDRIPANKSSNKLTSHQREQDRKIPNRTMRTKEENAKENPKHQILALVKDKSWLKTPPPLKSDPATRDTSKYCAFHGIHDHYTGNCTSWKIHLEELVRDENCTEFVVKKAFHHIEDRDAAKEPP
ncbi:uncharacterized protein LOC110757912 [Prunus avium]|uniref:Uncharacterized protein LOC110757912 n=1 Tax=Prunus avium TaxID=42229 RepID=A0A6P5SMA3_PRUAV|nr:uncharacterized protein LOC110757912 [Prunus avium]